ncbi:MAG: rhamnogalacturonan acetylesterase [Prevotellaceae bacterium]|jgi:lysophospholipase L1-like esterase|nr:rhamnogalacturonan acetylesterase [Prevotellaceae bacterium]
MKKLFLTTLMTVFFMALTAGNPETVRIFMAGDSTMADKDSIAFPETGWGMVLPSFFNENVVIENHARNGRSTRTFISEGRWEKMMAKVGAGDFVFIQFGHNDQSKNKPDRYTSPEDYRANLIRFVNDVREKGANPILFTPVMRRKFDKNGQFVDQHGVYPDLVRGVAQEMNVPLVDMHKSSEKLIVELGEEGSVKLFMHVAPGESKKYPDGNIDNTHFRREGAVEMAKLAVEGLKELNIKPLTDNLSKEEKFEIKLTKPVPNL